MTLSPITKPEVVYPDSDGQPKSDNTKQFRWIMTIQGGLDVLFASDPNVFVAGDLLWYPVEGSNTVKAAPDAMVVFGRTKGDPWGICEAARGSYQQWKEDNIPPQVVFEILAPSYTLIEMDKKFRFYERYGVEEYYLYDPDKGDFSGWLRAGDYLEVVENPSGWVSPRLQVRFELVDGQLEIYRPDGQKFATYLELEQRLAQEQQRVEKLAAKLKELGVNPEDL